MTLTTLLLIGGLGTPELIIILIVVLLLFGGKKIPELMKAMGKGVKNFKDGVSGIEKDLDVDDSKEAAEKKASEGNASGKDDKASDK